MRRLGLATLVVLPLVLAACSDNPRPASDETPAGGAPEQTTQAPTRKPVLLVEKLPEGVEGVELAEGGLRASKGYEFVKDSDSTMAVMRISTGRKTGGLGCGCKTTGGCTPVLRGGIAVCEADSCSSCGLSLTFGGVTTMIFAY